jgi:hypothetical protein
MLRGLPKRMEGGDEDFFYFSNIIKRFLPFSTPPPEMTWKPPRIAVGYASPPLFMYIYFRKKRPSCKHVEDGSKLQTRRRRRWPLHSFNSGRLFFLFFRPGTTQSFDPLNTSLTLVFFDLSPRYLFFSNYSFLSPSPLLNLQTLLGAKQKRALNPQKTDLKLRGV